MRKLGVPALRRGALRLRCLGRFMPLGLGAGLAPVIAGGLIGLELVSLLRARRVREFKVLLRSTFGHSGKDLKRGDEHVNQLYSA